MAKKKTPVWSIKGLAILLCKTEGKKEQVNVAQMAEILGQISDLIVDPLTMAPFIMTLVRNGRRRAKKPK